MEAFGGAPLSIDVRQRANDVRLRAIDIRQRAIDVRQRAIAVRQSAIDVRQRVNALLIIWLLTFILNLQSPSHSSLLPQRDRAKIQWNSVSI